MNYYVKLITRKDSQAKDGLNRLYLRITLNRKVRNVSLYKSVDSAHWDEDAGLVNKNNPEAEQLNLLLKSKKKIACLYDESGNE